PRRLTNHRVTSRTPAPLSAPFAAPADPTRRAIRARLASGEASVNDLAKPFAISGPAVSKHLKVLERAGLITRGREAQRRPRRLALRALQSLDAWLADYRRLWEQRLTTTSTRCRASRKATPRAERSTFAAKHPQRKGARGWPLLTASTSIRIPARSSPSASSMPRAPSCSRSGPIPSTWPSGGDRRASPPPPAPLTCAWVASGGS